MTIDLISVFEEGKEIGIKESSGYDIGGVYQNLVKFQNTEISKIVLIVTLTTEMETSGSYKAAEIR